MFRWSLEGLLPASHRREQPGLSPFLVGEIAPCLTPAILKAQTRPSRVQTRVATYDPHVGPISRPKAMTFAMFL